MANAPEGFSNYLRQIGQKGGVARTERKKAAGRRNVEKARAAKAAKRLRPMMVAPQPVQETLQKPLGAPWEGAVSLRAIREAAAAQRASGEQGGPIGSDLRVQQTGRRR
jgi:hypothetical protein